ncbi:glycosyltransferase family 87 protein [Flavobacterium terrisoli]|uniref:glycosyltransferase family 87 protein n=1 Tax=Flavobacterium terrisoli TaxID=3242195 RepID=UPI00254335F2|nr:glycosyltransferase family 87 protein [Flavobacterium buctense]
MKSAITKYYPFLPLLLLCCFYGYKAIAFPIHDFANYYFGGKFLSEGHFNSNIYFPYEFNKAIFDSGHPGIFASYAPNMPFLAVFFLAFSIFSLAAAKLIFNGISVVLFIFSIYRLFNYYKIDWRYALLIPVLFLVPIKNNLLFGQVYFLLFFLLAEGWLAYENERWKSMSFFWSLAILLKVFPVLLIALLLFRKQWKALCYLALTGVLLFGISLFFTGIEIWLFYLKEVLPKASNGEIATAFVPNYQSVFMFLKQCFVHENIENPHPFFQDESCFLGLVFAFKVGILTLGYFISKKTSHSLFIFSYWILAMILLSPYGSTYTFILLLFAFLALLKSEISNVKKMFCCLILFLVSNIQLSFFIDAAFPFSYLRLFLLIVFFVGFTIFIFQKSVWLKAIVIVFFAFYIGTFFEQKKLQRNELFLPKGSPILIYDYQIENNQLTYFYWNEKGENKTTIPLQNHFLKPLEIRKTQVFNDYRQRTSDNSHKLKPMLIDGKTIIYLSDYDRGIGFYTLRKIKLPKSEN